MAHLTPTAAAVLATALSVPSLAAAEPATRKRRGDDSDLATGYTDPRIRVAPRRHRFRLGIEAVYVRLTEAVQTDGTRQRFHLAPLGIEPAYQLQFLKWLMMRPAFSVAVNVANTNTSMPVFIHPKFHFGYQGALVGFAFGYGYLMPVVYRGNAIDPVRGGLGQPITLHNHHLDLELSFTTRLDHGALSFIARFGMNNGKLWHFDIRGDRSWRPVLTFNFGWYFGDGRRQRARERGGQDRRSY